MSKISVIVPIYNVEAYLEECLDSIITQTYKELEIILVNDGSTDNCIKICKRYKEQDDRIQIVDKPNGGLSSARNAGLDVASGELIAFVDSDDVLHPRFFEHLISNISDADYIFCLYEKFEDGTAINIKSDLPRYDVMNLSNNEMLNTLDTFHYPHSIVSWNKLYKAHIWSNLRFPNGKIHEDEFVIHEVLHRCKSIKFLNLELYYYRQRNFSITSGAKSEKAFLDSLEALQNRLQYFKKEGFKSAYDTLQGKIMFLTTEKYVSPNNPAWRAISFSDILTNKTIEPKLRLLLLIRKISENWYLNIQNRKNK